MSMILGLMIIYAFCAYGLSNIIIYSSGPFNIFTKFRENSNKYLPSNLGELFECMICFPTWVGLIMSTINIIFCPNISFTPFMLIFQNIEYWYLIIPFDGFFTSGIVWLIHTFQEMMERVNNNE